MHRMAVHDAEEDVRAAVTGELRLLEPAVRQDPAQVEALLHLDFAEFGASRRRWRRAGISTGWRAYFHQGTAIPDG